MEINVAKINYFYEDSSEVRLSDLNKSNVMTMDFTLNPKKVMITKIIISNLTTLKKKPVYILRIYFDIDESKSIGVLSPNKKRLMEIQSHLDRFW